MSSQDPTTGQSKNPEPLPPIPGPASKPGRTQPADTMPPWMVQQSPTGGFAPQDTPSTPTQAQAPMPGNRTADPHGPARAGRTGVQGTASQRAQGGASGTPGAPLPTPTARDNRASGRATNRPARGASPVAAQAQRRIGIPLWALVAALVVAIALVVTVIVLAARSCTSPRQPVTPATEQQWVSPYDWSNLKQLENGFFAYYNADGSLASEAGVDVSEHDGDIDWQAVKAAGADFAMIRLGYRGYSQGTLALDDYFLANIKGASDAGLKVGVYFFSQAITADEARQEAQYVIDTLAGLGITLAYPVAFDQEPITNGDVARTDNITDEQLTANAIAFCQAIEQAGYQAMIYGNQHDLARLDLTGELGAYPLWYAEYEAAGNVPTGKFNFSMWQYTASGTVSGIPTTAGQVDMNIRFLG